MAEKVTTMVLTVDLQCCKCYKKVKKILCKFPEIRDETYDEKNNKVIIKVATSCPEKMRDKLCCKGRGCITNIEILPPPKPQPPPPKPQPPPPKPQPPPPKPQPPPPKPDPPPPPKCDPPPPCKCEPPQPPKCDSPPPCKCKPRPPPKCDPPPPCKKPAPPAWCPVPVRTCCSDCSEGRGGGPCYNPCYGPPIRYYDGYCGRPVYDSWGGGCRCGCGGYYGCRSREYYCENPQVCTIM